jgi:hypothetical protein
MQSIDYFGTEKASFSGFYNFCRKNIPLLILVTVALFFSYGIKLVCYSVGIDTEQYLADKEGVQNFFIRINRYGLVLFAGLFVSFMAARRCVSVIP